MYVMCVFLIVFLFRMEAPAKVALVPELVQTLKHRPAAHQNTLLRLLAPLLGDIPMPTDPKEKENMYNLRQVNL